MVAGTSARELGGGGSRPGCEDEDERRAELASGLTSHDDVPLAERDARRMHAASTCERARMRMPGIFLSFLIEMPVAFVFSAFQGSFRRYPLLISFQPVISAISGNVGLQASSVNTRALALGLVSERKLSSGMPREVNAGFVIGCIMAAITGGTAFLFYSPAVTDHEGHTWAGALVFALAIGIGQFVSVVTAAASGSVAPLLFKRCKFDPTTLAGPMETGFQDVIGGTLLLAFSATILKIWGDFAESCPDGDLAACVASCTMAGATSGGTTAVYNTSCLSNCVRLADAGIC